MKYWWSLSFVEKRWLEATMLLSNAMRTFCYAFIIGTILKGPGEIKFGMILISESFQAYLSAIVIFFIFFDFIQYLLLVFLLLLAQQSLDKNRKYNGKAGEGYQNNLDDSELIFEQNPGISFGLNKVVPFILLVKTLLVLFCLSPLFFFVIKQLLFGYQ